MLVGIEWGDDAGIYKLNEETALIQTVDFFSPIVDNPYEFGQIAAANSMSDIYAMGGVPITAMNIIGFPIEKLEHKVLEDIMRGGLDKIEEAGASLVGGHSVDDLELKYGLSVTGVVHPNNIWANTGAAIGDKIILTKPIGVGIVSTAIKAEIASISDQKETIVLMSKLNQLASDAAKITGSVHACTDITGFGLIGHLSHILMASKVSANLFVNKIPLVNGSLSYSKMGLVPKGAHDNQKFYKKFVETKSDISTEMIDILYDPQTSGGLLFCIKSDKVHKLCDEMISRGESEPAIIGEIISKEDREKIILV